MTRVTRLMILLGGSALLLACAPTLEVHGFVPSRSEIEAIEPGVDTVDTVEENLGRPANVGLVDGGGWYYVATTIENFTYNPPKVIDRTVVAVLFNGDGVVTDVNSYGLEDGRVVNLNTNVTVTNGRTLGVLEQVFGNLGRIRTSDIIQ